MGEKKCYVNLIIAIVLLVVAFVVYKNIPIVVEIIVKNLGEVGTLQEGIIVMVGSTIIVLVVSIMLFIVGIMLFIGFIREMKIIRLGKKNTYKKIVGKD